MFIYIKINNTCYVIVNVILGISFYLNFTIISFPIVVCQIHLESLLI